MSYSLVAISSLLPDAELDIRYAGDDNFMGRAVYGSSKAYLLEPALIALRAATDEFKRRGYGIIVWDAYRPLSVSKLFWDATPVNLHNFVEYPSVHNRGCAVDMTLYDLTTGAQLKMPSDFDAFEDAACMSYVPADLLVLQNRELLQSVMANYGFTVHPDEWWHYNFNEYTKYPALDTPLENLT